MKLSGAQILMRVLQEEGVDTIFGYPGGVVLDIYHELAKTDIRHVLVRHEQGAVHAADGYARVSGKVGVCLVTSGPGATNTVTGIANAYMDSIPVVVMTGYPSIENTIKTLKNGVVDFLIKPVSLNQMELCLKRVFREQQLFVENVLLKQEVEGKARLTGATVTYDQSVTAKGALINPPVA